MTTGACPPLTLPFGVAAAAAGAGTGPCAALAPGRPLRLNDAGWDFVDPPDVARLRDRGAALDFLRDRLKGLCDPWAAHQGRFLEAYFAFVAAHVARTASALATRLAPFGDLYRVEDFAFSALRPLPRAHVPDDAGWIAVDFALWSGTVLITVDIADGRRTVRQRAADHARLRAAGAQVVDLAPDGLAGDLAARLPEAVVRFCDGEALPSSPFRAAALADIVDVATVRD